MEVVAYDPSWPVQFQAECIALQEVLAPLLVSSIEHIGSTAVPTLAAKPIIDIMAPVRTLAASNAAIGLLGSGGYAYYPYKPHVMHWFCKPSPHYRTHHLHLVPIGSPLWQQRIAFRDALRQSATLIAEYAALKRQLAETFRHDRDAYTNAKTPFIQRVLSELK